MSSRWLKRADELKEVIEAISGWSSDIPVLVDRQRDLAAEVAVGLSRQKMAAVIVSFVSAENPDKGSNGLLTGGRYTIAVLGHPVLLNAQSQAPIDELTESVAEAVHDWVPEVAVGKNEKTRRFSVEAIEFVPEFEFGEGTRKLRAVAYVITGGFLRV